MVRHARSRAGARPHGGRPSRGHQAACAKQGRSAGSNAFDQAKARADRLGQVVRASGHYPLLGGGDINLYSLFVERSLRLVKPGGLVGLLTPSGIYADKTAARFFKSVSTTGRVAGTLRLREPPPGNRPTALLQADIRRLASSSAP